MYDLPLTEELDGIPHVGVVAQTENVVIGDPGLLLGYDLGLITFLCPFSGAIFLEIPMNFYGRMLLSLDSFTNGDMVNEDFYHFSGQMRYIGVLLYKFTAVIA